MNTQPEALRLADALQRAVKQLDPEDHVAQIADWFLEDAAAELRRLHTLNAELLEALKLIAETNLSGADDYCKGMMFEVAIHNARIAIARAEGTCKAEVEQA